MTALGLWLVMAAAGFVAVGQPPPDDRLLDESSSRLRSELAASGFESRFVDCADPAGCASPDALATISLQHDNEQIAIRVRAVRPDGLELSRTVRVRAGEGADDPAVLAIRAVELLRDVRLDIDRPGPSATGRQARRSAPPAQDGEDPQQAPAAPAPEPPVWRLTCGPAMLASAARATPGIGPAFGAALGVDVTIAPQISAVLTLAGPFDRSLSPYSFGQATLLQALGQVGLRYWFDVSRARPFVAAFVGVDYLRAATASFAGDASTVSTWVPLGGVGAGASIEFLRRFSARLEGDVFATEPQVSVVIASRNLGRAGAPSFLVAAAMAVVLP